MNDFGELSMQQLEIFLAVAECESITTAARRLFISQSAASRLIQKMEACVQTQLFARNNRGVELTEQGEQLYRQIKLYYTKLHSAFYNIVQSGASERTVRLACLDATETLDEFSPLVKRFGQLYPGVFLEVKVCNHHDLREGILAGAFDCAFTYSAASHGLSGLEMRYYKQVDTYFAVSANCPAIEGDHLNYEKLSRCNLYIRLAARHDFTGTRDLSICRAHGFAPAGIQYLTDSTAIAGMVLDTNGISITGKAFGLEFGDSIRLFKVEKPLEEEQFIVLLWRPDEADADTHRFVQSVPYLSAETL